MHPLPPTRIADLLQAYLQARYAWEHAGHWHRLRIGAGAPQVEAAMPGVACFALISAWNPSSVPCDAATNQRQSRRLHQQLMDAGYRCHAASASAPDGRWHEAGWLVGGLPASALDALARAFGQLGTLAWAAGAPVQLRMDTAAPAGDPPRAHVHWLN